MIRRTNLISKVDAILTADWHLREDTPTCRTDDFPTAQWDKVQQVADLQQQYNCPVLHAGDLFDHWKPSPELLSKAIKYLPKRFFTVYGQHDLPQHNFELYYKSGIHTLESAGAITVLEGGHWKQEPGIMSRGVGVSHRFVWDGKKIPWPGCDEITALQMLKQYSEFKLIVTGDHHKPFVQEYKGRLLVNPGCLTRQDASYIDHHPRVYLWDSMTNTVTIQYLKINKEAVTREHLVKTELRQQRLDAFISRLSDEWELSVSFEANLDRFLKANKVRQPVVDILYEAIEK